MGEHRRKADGRRVFSTDFKRAAVQRVVTGEKTVAELTGVYSREPGVWRGAAVIVNATRPSSARRRRHRRRAPSDPDQRPLNIGARFSPKARMPSVASSVSKQMFCAMVSIWSALRRSRSSLA